MNHENQKLDLNATWNDAMALMRANTEIVLILGGLFIFVPTLLFALIAGDPPIVSSMSLDQLNEALLEWSNDYGLLGVITTVVSMLGTLAIMFVVLNPAKPTVGNALAMAGSVLIFYVIAQILSGFAIALGFLLLIVPGIYIMVKLLLVPAVVAAENVRGPIAMLQRSWALTKGNSLRLFGLALLITIAAFVAITIISIVFSILFGILLPDGAATLAVKFVDSLLQTGMTLLFIHIYMAVYRGLAAMGR